MWRLHAPPSREADINPNPKKGGYPAPDRVTFLTGANRDFPNWRRQTTSVNRSLHLDRPWEEPCLLRFARRLRRKGTARAGARGPWVEPSELSVYLFAS